jgi:hypothetical protein
MKYFVGLAAGTGEVLMLGTAALAASSAATWEAEDWLRTE